MPSSRSDLQKLLAAIEKRLLEAERQLLKSLPPEEHARLIELAAGLEIVKKDTLQALTDGERPENSGK